MKNVQNFKWAELILRSERKHRFLPTLEENNKGYKINTHKHMHTYSSLFRVQQCAIWKGFNGDKYFVLKKLIRAIVTMKSLNNFNVK